MGPRSDFSKPRQGAAEKSANATRRCCLVRGSRPVGMSTGGDFLFCRIVLYDAIVFMPKKALADRAGLRTLKSDANRVGSSMGMSSFSTCPFVETRYKKALSLIFACVLLSIYNLMPNIKSASANKTKDRAVNGTQLTQCRRIYNGDFCVAKSLFGGSTPNPFVLHFPMQAAPPCRMLLRVSISTS